MISALKDKVVDAALGQIVDRALNPKLADIARISKVAIEDGTLSIHFILKGLDEKEMDVQCSSISIAEDGSSISLGNYTSNIEFLQNALNQFATLTLPVPDNTMTRAILKTVKAVLNI